MAGFNSHIDFNTALETTVAPTVSVSLPLILVDDDQIPIDQRLRLFTQSSYSDELAAGTVPYKYLQKLWSQAIRAPLAMVGRWAKVATSPMFICGPGYEQTLATWVAETAGSFKIADNAGTPNVDEVTGVSFAAATSLAQVATILTAAIQAISSPNITGLDTSEFIFDSPGRLVLKMSTTGAASASVSITTAASGSDISVPLLDAPNGTVVAGIDAEEPTDALDAISAINDTYYNINIRGESAGQQLALAAYVEAKSKLLDLWVSDPLAKDPADVTDIGHLVKTAGYTRTTCIYSERGDEYGDACANGRFLPGVPGEVDFAWNALVGVGESGYPSALSTSNLVALKAKNYSYFETYVSPSASTTSLYPGFTASGIEKRIMWGVDWFDSRNTLDIWAWRMNIPLATFSNDDLTSLEGILQSNGAEAIKRRVIQNTQARPFTTRFPDADDFSSAERGTHKLTLTDVYHAWLDVNWVDVQITGTFSI